MPRAVVDPSINQKKIDLSTLPGAFVLLRQLTYGEQIQKQQMAAKMTFEGPGSGSRGGGEFEFFQRKVAEYEFATCIIEHNLEDEEGNLLNFKMGAVLDRLDPRVGSEVASHISEMNDYQEETDFLGGNSARP